MTTKVPPSPEGEMPPREAQWDDWYDIGEESAKAYAREFGGFPRGTSLISVNGHTRGWNDCIKLVVKPLLQEHVALIAEAKREASDDAEEALWKRLNEWKPTLHFCMEWDFLLIDKEDREFAACSCGPFPLKYARGERP